MQQIKENAISASTKFPSLTDLQRNPLPEDFHTLTEPLRFTMMNDALFHIVFEANPDALRHLISALLEIDLADINSLEVTNPIDFGNSIYAKDFVLDIKILLNNDTMINIEMQVVNLKFWKERSLGYLCRTFDNLNKGEDYALTKPAIHIGILDFEIFKDDTEFYATYHLANDISHKIYSDKFRLSVLQLRQAEHAADNDRKHNRYLWAKFFKANTWEEIHMLAEQNPYIADAAKTMYRVTADERIRQLCEAREMGERTQRTLDRTIETQLGIIKTQLTQISNQQETIENQEQKITGQQNQIVEQQNQIVEQQNQISEQQNQISEQQNQISEQQNQISEQQNQISEQQNQISEQQAEIARLKALLGNSSITQS